jgi:hypothetical protein
MTRNQIRFAETRATILAEPTSIQREAFELIGAPICRSPQVAKTQIRQEQQNPRPAARPPTEKAPTSD